MRQPVERVLVLDAHLRHALAIVRSLGRRGVHVVMGSPHRRFPAYYSRYGMGAELIDHDPSPIELLRLVDKHQIEVVIAAGLPGNRCLCQHRGQFEGRVKAAFNDLEVFDCLSNKSATGLLAKDLGVRCPMTRQLRAYEEISDLVDELSFPAVFKSPVDQGTVRYARDIEDLQRLFTLFGDEHPDLLDRGLYPIVQEYIAGDGYGFYGLAAEGELRAYFMHRRLHEVPPSGGPSAMAMSYRDAALKDLGERFFAATHWNGVAMVEFKRSRRDGQFYLIEVNPKFWGSLDLSIAAGVDFPFLLYQMLVGEPLDVEPGVYQDDTVFRWLTMDLAYAVAARRIRPYLRSFADDRITNDFDRSDPLPMGALFASGIWRASEPSRKQVRSLIVSARCPAQ